jgi:hypothetical protein
VNCPSCENEVPAGTYCARCGEELATATAGSGSNRKDFAAAPGERLSRPAVVSTIFPQLPNDSMQTFRVSLAIGVAVIVALAAVGLFPVALIASAILVPLVTVIYLYDVDVYEDQPYYVVGITMLGGALAGVALALLSGALAPADAAFVTEEAGSDVLWRGVLLPALSVALILIGPVVLLRYRKFNDVLDGSTFGAASAIAFSGAEVLTQGLSFLADGPTPDGLFVPWLVRLITIAIVAPVLTAGLLGAVGGALWLRYRAPVRDRDELGPLGNPPVAIAVAVAVLIVAAVVQIYLPGGSSLAILVLLAIAALIWLRRVIHRGLLQEASEIEIGPDITCANCGDQTASHTFCQNCGISQRALPKSRLGQAPPPTGDPSGAQA